MRWCANWPVSPPDQVMFLCDNHFTFAPSPTIIITGCHVEQPPQIHASTHPAQFFPIRFGLADPALHPNPDEPRAVGIKSRNAIPVDEGKQRAAKHRTGQQTIHRHRASHLPLRRGKTSTHRSSTIFGMKILGTKTHYQQVKPYQERLDSDHVMDL